MALEAVSGTPGLWRDPHWQAGMPGVYALIIGVSAYRHLEGGPAPAPDSYGLGQLLSSARTAAHVFNWLRTDFHYEDLPVVWALLLLSPSAEEDAEFRTTGLTHYDHPDYARMRLAIQRWTAAVPKQAPASAQSRSVFFFSGHGVGANRTPVLLPADYLDPQFGDPQLENCFSARELQRWMTENPVGEHLALLDACRNEFSPLAEKASSAHGAFPVNPPNAPAPRAAATLTSTSPNMVAYQFPGQPLTLFGQAVLEALSGGADTGNLRIDFREVVDYVRPRINVLLKAVNTALDQTVWPSSEGDDLIVTELAGPPLATRSAIATPRTANATYRGRGVSAQRPASVAADLASAAGAAVDARFDASLQVDDEVPLEALRGDFHQSCRRFGHEYASMIWADGRVRLHSLADGAVLEHAVSIGSVARDAASSIIQVALAVGPHPHGALLVFDGAQDVQRTRLAVALPTDGDSPVPIRLTLTIGSAQTRATRTTTTCGVLPARPNSPACATPPGVRIPNGSRTPPATNCAIRPRPPPACCCWRAPACSLRWATGRATSCSCSPLCPTQRCCGRSRCAARSPEAMTNPSAWTPPCRRWPRCSPACSIGACRCLRMRSSWRTARCATCGARPCPERSPRGYHASACGSNGPSR